MSRLQRIEQSIGALRGALPVRHSLPKKALIGVLQMLMDIGAKAEARKAIGGTTNPQEEA